MSTTRKKNNIFKVILSGVTAAVIIAASAAVTTEAPLPVKSYGDDFVRCNAAICYDLTDGKVIYSKNAGKKVFPASTTKILTALTAIEYTAPEYEYYVGSELGLVAQDSRRLKPLQKRDTASYARSFGERCGIYHSGKCGKEAVRR